MPPTVYLDTSVILHLTDPPSPNPITRACQQLTRLWWENCRVPNMTYVSKYVVKEIEEGMPLRMQRRLKAIDNLVCYPVSDRAHSIAELLSLGAGLTARANESSRHIACAALNHNDILLTWNCRDIANARRLPALRFLMDAEELQLPELVTPFELMENRHEDF
ncbi:type II toxin-antitoxin system VapC family toxin [Duganella sp. HH101]|uniref:type II toxin-antitoxin system VapC family toxin n=1 Tax=Duganella sp. HH101 TaxID=1781066 RepID=UPI0008940C7B|nr:type II toxin-antitoxin system VapC family toxin [Duganella sp. HH101]OFA00338.1 hypothetical protein DUGA2_48790 [Duganella sp. HH101]